VRIRLPALLFLCACSGASTPVPAEPLPSDRPGTAHPSSGEGWGAVFWQDGVAWKVGGGLETIGPGGRTTATVRSAEPGYCGGVALDHATPNAVVAAPVGTTGEAPAKPAVIAAATVEAAAWRLDEVLPGRDRFTPVNPDAAPALQRGVEVGSVVKVRRYGGPPVLLVSGRRGSSGALLVLDREATRVEAKVQVEGLTSTPRVLPPADIDGDGAAETALFTRTETLLARLELTPSTVGLQSLEWWTCSNGEAL